MAIETFLPVHFPTRQLIERYLGRGKNIHQFMDIAGGSAQTFIWRDEFVGDTVNATYRVMGTGTPTQSIITDTVNGMATLTTTAVSGDSSGLSLGLHCQGQLYPVLIARVKSETITTQKIEVGFSDSHSNDGFVNNMATPTFTGSNGAVWIMDRNTDANWHIRSAAAGVTGANTNPAIALVAATYAYVVVALEDGNARFYLADANGFVVHDSGWKTSAITKTTSVTPWLYTQTRAASARTLDIDLLWVWQRRTTA